MSNVLLDFTVLGNSNPYIPPADWLSVGQVQGQISVGAFSSTSTSNAIYVYDRAPTGLLTSSVVIGAVSSDSAGIAFVNSSGNGYQLLVRNFDARLFKVAAGALTTQVGTSYTGTFATNDVVLGTLNPSTGAFVFSKNGTQFTTFTDTTYSTGLRAGIHSRSVNAKIKSVTLSDYVLQSVTSINGGNPITAGKTGVVIVASGFPSKPDTITATYAGGTKSITATIDAGGTANNFTMSVQDRIEAEDWPLNNSDVTYTFSVGAASASLTQALVKKANETVLPFSGAITSDPATLTYWLTQDGFAVEGGEMAYEQPPATGTMPTPDLVLTPSGGGSVKEACTFNTWFRPIVDKDGYPGRAGNVYEYQWVITEAGISPAGSSNTGVTKVKAVNLTCSKLTTRRI